MTGTIDLKEIEQKTYRALHQDGLLDMCGGICLLGGAAVIYTNIVIFSFTPFILFPLLRIAKRHLTYPRIGYVNLINDQPKTVLKGIFTVMLILFVIMAGLLALFGDITDFGQWQQWLPAFFGVLFVGMFHYLAEKSGSIRPYFLAAFSVLSGIVLSLISFEWKGNGLFLYFVLIGSAFLLSGVQIFFCFMKNHPYPAEEVCDEQE